MDTAMMSKNTLIRYLEIIRDAEVAKPLGKMDTDLIKACVALLLDLQDKAVALTPEDIKIKVENIPFAEAGAATINTEARKKHKRPYKKGTLLIAAVITALAVTLSIAAIANEKGAIDILEEHFGAYDSIPFGKIFKINGEDYEKLDCVKYDSIEEAVSTEKLDILYPKKLPKGYTVKSISMEHSINTVTIASVDTMFSLEIVFNPVENDDIEEICNDTVTVNGIECNLCIMDDISQTQAYFTYNNASYTLVCKNKDIAIQILEGLEEIRSES